MSGFHRNKNTRRQCELLPEKGLKVLSKYITLGPAPGAQLGWSIARGSRLASLHFLHGTEQLTGAI